MDKCNICGKHKAKYTVKLFTDGKHDLPTYQVCGYCLKHPELLVSDDGWRLSEKGMEKVEEGVKKITKKYKGKKLTDKVVREIFLDVLDFCARVVSSED